jgi:microtubule-associated protein-like 1/2
MVCLFKFNYKRDILQEQAQSVCFSPDGTIMVVGCLSGKWLAIDSETRELYSYHSDGSEALQV